MHRKRRAPIMPMLSLRLWGKGVATTDLTAALARGAANEAFDRRWDAIVAGAGATGGLAALLLCRAGLDVLVLDAGWRPPFWRAPYRSSLAAVARAAQSSGLADRLPPKLQRVAHLALKVAGLPRQPVQSKCFAWALDPDQFVDDRDDPYVAEPDAPFRWYRSRQLGGRMGIPGHGRQYYRMARDEFGPEWPLRAEDLDPWYDQVEALLGLRGRSEGLESLPDQRIGEAAIPSADEAALMARLRAWRPEIELALSRSAPPLAALAMAAETGRLAIRQGAVAREALTDGAGRAAGLVWFDRATRRLESAKAPIVVLAASAFESARILMMSRPSHAPEGLGAESGALGAYAQDHVLVSGDGLGDPLAGAPGPLAPGRCVIAPRVDKVVPNPTGAPFGVQLYSWPTSPETSAFTAVSFSCMRPRKENRIMLDPDRRDAWGAPALRIAVRFDDAERRAAEAQSQAIALLAAACDVKLHRLDTTPAPPGTAIHECGVARMGADAASSVVGPFGECWDAPGLFVADAAAFPSMGRANPTLTAMALCARAMDHAMRGLGVRPTAGTAAPAAAPGLAAPSSPA